MVLKESDFGKISEYRYSDLMNSSYFHLTRECRGVYRRGGGGGSARPTQIDPYMFVLARFN